MGKNQKYLALDTLVAKAIEGDKKSFEQLCERESASILFSCIKFMGNTQAGEDAAQEVFIQLQKNLSGLQSPQAYVTWLHKVIVSVCIKMRRKSMSSSYDVSIEEFADLFSESDADVLPEAYVFNKEKSLELREIVDALPDRIRMAIHLYYFKSLKISEVAQALSLTEGAVKSYLYLGREKIRKALETRGGYLNLRGAALLPMGAIATLLQQEMNEKITPAMVRRVLDSAGVHSLPVAKTAAKALPISVVKDTLIAVAVTLLAGVAFAGYSIAAFAPSAGSRAQGSAPQRHPAASVAGEAEDRVASPATKQPVTSPPDAIPMEPGGVLWASPPVEEPIPAAQPPPAAPATQPQGVPTVVQGQLAVQDVLQNSQTAPLEGNRFFVTVEYGGQQLAATEVTANGHFVFENLAIEDEGSYQLVFTGLYSYGFGFAPETPDGRVEVQLTPGQAYTLETPVRVVDNEPPTLAVLPANHSRKNPDEIHIAVQDATATATTWRIEDTSGQTVAEGDTTHIAQQVLAALQNGEYTVVAQAQDAAGNQTTKHYPISIEWAALKTPNV